MTNRSAPAFSVLLLTACMLTSWSSAGFALPNDREKPIHITADKAVRDEMRGVTIYSGNVTMRQGSMKLDANNLTIYHESHDADRIVARGQPAKMRQRPEVDKGLVHARANVITYFRQRELVHLRKDARLEKDDGTLITGESIDYFIDKELVKAKSNQNDKTDQIFVVIPPSLTQEEGDAADSSPAENVEDPNTGQDPGTSTVTPSDDTADIAVAKNTEKDAPSGGEAPSE